MLTFEEFRDIMSDIKEEYQDDEEERHILMDATMCKLLIDLGYREGVEIFKDTYKWYS